MGKQCRQEKRHYGREIDMGESTNPAALLGQALLDAIRQAVREEIQVAFQKSEQQEEEKLLSADEAAQFLNVSPDWLYRNARRLPFTRKVGNRMIRFSYKGALKWLSSQKP
jgi:predicted DNA-binding transcriptional regulator AlpA